MIYATRRSPTTEISATSEVGWSDMPLPVLAQILQVMTAKEMWAVRAVGNYWACAVRSTIGFVLTIQATDRNLKAKLSAIHRRQRHYPLAQFVLRLKKGRSFHRSAKLLLSVAELGDCLPVVQLVLPVRSSEADAESDKDASFVAIACTWLQDRGVQVCLELSSTAKAKLAPAPAVVKQLAPFSRSVDYHPMPDLLELFPPLTHNSQLCFTESHVGALASAGQLLQTLCISDCVQPYSDSFQAQIPSIAALSNLTKLHLDMRGQPDFRPLAQLNKLEDLALRCSSPGSDCSQVIYSNRFSLQYLTVGSHSWTDSTYAAVSQVASLQDVVFLVHWLSESNAALAGDLEHPSSVAVHLSACPLTSLHVLSSGRSKISYIAFGPIMLPARLPAVAIGF